MVKHKVIYQCTECGAESAKWQGRCFSCQAFGTLERILERSGLQSREVLRPGSQQVVSLNDVKSQRQERLLTGINELDRVLGGGIVGGSSILLVGEPGYGKSTLLLQLASKLASELPVLYIAAEESAEQIKLRSMRLKVSGQQVLVLTTTDASFLPQLIEEYHHRVSLVVVDSIQALSDSEIDSYSGSIKQVKEIAKNLSRVCKSLSLPLIMVGHVTKAGSIAGPKTLEHIVDVVVHLEGSKTSSLRLLRSIKNRFGSALELGFFKMTAQGLQELKDPSSDLISNHEEARTGSVISVALDGLRPLVLEVQSLTTTSRYGNPIRNVTGISYKRLVMLLAVLEKKLNLKLGNYNIFVNLSGGIRIYEPGIDLPVCLSILSSVRDKPLDPQITSFGEVGLLGKVKPVSQQDKRIEAARKLGFNKIVSSEEISEIAELERYLDNFN